MRNASIKHALVTASLNNIAGILIAFAFSANQLNAWWIENPLQLFVLLGLGFGIATVISVGISQLPFSALRLSPVQRVAANASFGLLFGLIGGLSGMLIAYYSLLGLIFWFVVGASAMSFHYTLCPTNGTSNG